MPEINKDNNCTKDNMSFSNIEDIEDSANEYNDGISNAEINNLSYRNSNSNEEKPKGFKEFA